MMIRLVSPLVVAAGLVAGAAAQAQTTTVAPGYPATGAANGANFANHRQAELAKIQTRMQVLQQLQSCVGAAQSTEAVHQCNETARAANGHHEKKC